MKYLLITILLLPFGGYAQINPVTGNRANQLTTFYGILRISGQSNIPVRDTVTFFDAAHKNGSIVLRPQGGFYGYDSISHAWLRLSYEQAVTPPVLPEYANDEDAHNNNIPIGGYYRTESFVKQRTQ